MAKFYEKLTVKPVSRMLNSFIVKAAAAKKVVSQEDMDNKSAVANGIRSCKDPKKLLEELEASICAGDLGITANVSDLKEIAQRLVKEIYDSNLPKGHMYASNFEELLK